MLMLSLDSAPRSLVNVYQIPGSFWNEAREVQRTAATYNQIGYILLNQTLLDQAPPIVAVGGFMSDVTTPDRLYEGLQLSALERPVMLIDMPGHGRSSRHSLKQTYDLCIKRSADSTALSMVTAVRNVLGANDPIDYFGVSHGGHLALKMTELDSNDRVGTVVGIDISGTRDETTYTVQKGYWVKDRSNRQSYRHQLAHSQAQLDYNHFQWEYGIQHLKKAPSFIVKNPGLFILNSLASINARPGALNAIKNIMTNRSAQVELFSGALSSVSNWQAIEELRQKLPADVRSRFGHTIIDDEDHNMGMTELMPRATLWAAKAYSRAA